MKMGLEVYDKSGNTIFAVTDRLTRILGEVVGTIDSPTDGSIVVPNDIIGGGRLFYQFIRRYDLDLLYALDHNTAINVFGYYFHQSKYHTIVRIDGNTIFYENLVGVLMYGVY